MTHVASDYAPERVTESGSVDRTAIFLKHDGIGRRVQPSSLIDVAKLLECPVEDLTFLRYGENGQMAMSRSRQTDRSFKPNKSATIVAAKIHQLPVAPRGSVVCFPHGFTWEASSVGA